MNSNQPIFPKFTIRVKDTTYFITPVCEPDCIYYEVWINYEKLFELELAADGHWRAVEDGLVPVYDELLDSIGNAILKHQSFS